MKRGRVGTPKPLMIHNPSFMGTHSFCVEAESNMDSRFIFFTCNTGQLAADALLKQKIVSALRHMVVANGAHVLPTFKQASAPCSEDVRYTGRQHYAAGGRRLMKI